MSNYLTRLVARTLAPVALRPRTRLRFEDAPALPPVAEETSARIAASSAPMIHTEIAAAPPHSEIFVESRPEPPRRVAARAEPEPPRRETRVHEDEPWPSVTFELPRPATHEDARETPRTEVVRVEAPPQRMTTHVPGQTVVETRESVMRERETLAVHDERVVQTRERVEQTPLAPPSPRKRSEGIEAARPARAIPRTAAPAQPQQPPEPTIHVAIGRIEVRATTQAAAPRRREAAPALTLDAYLQRRNGKSGR